MSYSSSRSFKVAAAICIVAFAIEGKSLNCTVQLSTKQYCINSSIQMMYPRLLSSRLFTRRSTSDKSNMVSYTSNRITVGIFGGSLFGVICVRFMFCNLMQAGRKLAQIVPSFTRLFSGFYSFIGLILDGALPGYHA